MPNKTSALDVSPDEREKAYEASWNRLGFGFALTYYDILLNKQANDTAAEFIRRKISGLVNDPVLCDKLTPKNHPFASRRPSVDSGYFQAFNRDNVELADVREFPIQEFTPEGIRTEDKLHTFDMIIFATGFDVFTGSLFKPEIIGRAGMTLKQKWADGPVTHLGIGVSDFPNMFIVVGPGSPSLLSNVIVSTEEQIDWMADLVQTMKQQGSVEVEVSPEAEKVWGQHINDRVKETLYLSTDSYYNGAEVKGKPRVFMPYSGGVRGYRRILRQCATEAYSGFHFYKTPAALSIGKDLAKA
jgi:cyclohexanone monooxygenase